MITRRPLLPEEVDVSLHPFLTFENQKVVLGSKYLHIWRICPNCGEGSYVSVHRIRQKGAGYKGRCASCALHRRPGSQWRGGRSRKPDGYIYVFAPEHPYSKKDGYIAEHRLVMERKLGRYLQPFEKVHHLNGLRDDNDEHNLELWQRAQPTGVRVIDTIPHCATCTCQEQMREV